MKRAARGLLLALALASAPAALAQVSVYEATGVFPDEASPSWERIGTFDADRWIENGLFFQFVELGIWAPPPFGEFDGYRRSIPEYAATPAFFIEWIVQTNVPSSDISGSPVVLTASGDGPANYHFTVTDTQVRFLRDVPLQLELYVDVQPNVPHLYRLEVLDGVNYSWFIDGELINSGSSIASYPTSSSRIVWSARYYLTEHTTQWNYIRFGVIPPDQSGDFDNDSDVDANDLYFFVDCLLGPGSSWPGCTWADMNDDGVADGRDIALFTQAMVGG